MSELQLVLVIITFAGLVIITLIVFKLFWQVRLVVFKYQLYAVRDELIWLLAQDKVRKDDFLFQEVYPMVNNLIQNIKEIKLDIITQITEEELNRVKSEQFKARFLSEIQKAPEEVKQTILKLLTAIGLILVHNSALLCIALFLHLTSLALFKAIFRQCKRIFPTEYKAYKQYGEISTVRLK